MEKDILGKRDIFKKSLIMIYDSIIYILLFEIIYKALILIIFKPILEIIVSLFNKDGAYKVLVNENITRLLIKSTGYFMILIVTVMSIILVYYELTAILLILDRSRKKERIELLEIFQIAKTKLQNTIKNKDIGIFLYIGALIPILNLGIQSSLYPVFSMPHFIIKKFDKYPAGKILLTLLVLGFIYLFTKLFIVMPIMIFSNKTFKEAWKISFKTIKGQGYKIAILIISVILICLVLSYPPLMILENMKLKLPKPLRSSANIAVTIFTLSISPLIMAISLGNYKSYARSSHITREEAYGQIEDRYTGKGLWPILEKILEIVQAQILKVENYKKLFIFVVLSLIIGLNIYSDQSVRPIYDKQLLIGHRGGDHGVENTIDAVLYAGINGADYAEIDVLLSKDNVPVVIHDNNLKRLADTSKKISNLLVKQVKEVTIEDGDNEDDIPLLEELAKATKGKAKLLVEFKTHGKEKESVVDKSMEILEKEGILEKTIFQTAEEDILKEFNEKYKDLSIGYIFKGEMGVFPLAKLSNISADFISVKETIINKKMIKELHKSEKAVFTWTTNNDYKAERLLKFGVDGIITDHSVEMTELRDKYKDYY